MCIYIYVCVSLKHLNIDWHKTCSCFEMNVGQLVNTRAQGITGTFIVNFGTLKIV